MKKETAHPNLIDCNQYDFLESWSIKQEKVDITYTENSEVKTVSRVTINNIFAKNHIEYLTTSSGKTIPLADIISINGIRFKVGCG